MKVATACVSLTDENMRELGSATRVFDQGIEGEFRVCSLAMQAGVRVLIISVDALIVPREVVERAGVAIEKETGIGADNIMICATHTHAGPCCIDFFNFVPDLEFLRRIERGCVLAAQRSVQLLESTDSEFELVIGKSQEATVGRNSRLLLKDGSIGWYGYQESDIVGPTGPYDPDLFVLAARKADSSFGAIAFNHSVHNIGKLTPDLMSPGFYALAAQKLERDNGSKTLFLPGAFGSTHNATYENSAVETEKCIDRVYNAVEEALKSAVPTNLNKIRVRNKEFSYQIRHFDEATEAANVEYCMRKYAADEADYFVKAFADMREEMRTLQGSLCSTRLQVFELGDLAVVGIPGEMFAKLGLDLRKRSPYRNNLVVGLANEEIGYIPDLAAYSAGGYQTWAGWHSRLEPGSGEAMVDQALEMLENLYNTR